MTRSASAATMRRLIALGRARNFPLSQFQKALAAACSVEDSGQLLRQLLGEWTGLSLSTARARKVWTDIERLFPVLRDSLGTPLGLQTVLLHYFHGRKGLLNKPHLVAERDLTRLRRTAITDPLTGLYNRRFLTEILARQILRAARSGAPVSAVILDLEGFKAVNDRFGHATGDRALVKTAQVIRESLRPGDVPCRWGGDEFVVVLPDADLLASFAVAERIRRKVVAAAGEVRADLKLGLYYGVASFPSDAKSLASLLKIADIRLYQCREQLRFDGGNRRQYPRFAPGRLHLRLHSSNAAPAWSAPVVNVSYAGLAFEAQEEHALPRQSEGELSRDSTDGHPVKIRVINSAPLPDGLVRVGCKYA